MARRKRLDAKSLHSESLHGEIFGAGHVKAGGLGGEAGSPASPEQPDALSAVPRIASPELSPAQTEPAEPMLDIAPEPIAGPSVAELPPLEASHTTSFAAVMGGVLPPSRFARLQRFSPLAATIAVAAALGAMGGSLATAGLLHLAADPAPAIRAADATGSVTKDTLSRLDAELAALKTSLDQSGRAHTTQMGKIVERLDRAEKARAETPGRLEKITDALDRIEKRSTVAAAPAIAPPDVTGAVAATQVLAHPPAAGKAVMLQNWTLRDVYNGAAMIEGRRYGVIEVIPGDTIPGVGRVDSIKRVEGRWTVFTAKGVIVGH